MAGISSISGSGLSSPVLQSPLESLSASDGEPGSSGEETEPVVIDLSGKSLQREMIYESVQSQDQVQSTVSTDGSSNTDDAESSTSNEGAAEGEGEEGEEQEDDGPPPAPPKMPNLSSLGGSFFSQGTRGSSSGGLFGVSSFPTGGNSFRDAGSHYYPGSSDGGQSGSLLPSMFGGGSPSVAGSASPIPNLGVFSPGDPEPVPSFEVFGSDFQAVVPVGSSPEAGGLFRSEGDPESATTSAVDLLSSFAMDELARMSQLAASLSQGFGSLPFAPARQDDYVAQLLNTVA